MRQVSSCPEPAVLECLLDDSLDRPQRRALERHVNRCEACQLRLESLTYDAEGSPRPIPCPGREVLRRYSDGALSSFAWETVEHHIETCSACQEVVEAYSNGEEPPPETPRCPDARSLRALLDGRLDGPAQAAI